MKITISCVWMILLLGSYHVMAQSDAALAEKPKIPYSVRILAVGTLPPLKIVHRDGKRIQLPPEKGAIPPLTLYVKSSGELVQLSQRLGRISEISRIKLNEDRKMGLFTNAAEDDQDSGASPWCRVNLPPGKKGLVLLYKKHNAKNWSEPLSMSLQDELERFPANAVRLINLSALPVVVKIGDDKPSVFNPGKYLIFKKSEIKIELGLYVKNNKGKYVRLYRSSFRNQGATRTNVILYKEQPRSHGKPPVGVMVLRDRV